MLSRIGNIHWVVLANLTQSGVSIVILLSIIRMGSQEDVGNYSYVQGILLPIQLFFTLKLRTIQCADHGSNFGYQDYHQVRRLMALCNLVVGLVVMATIMEQQRLHIGLFILASYSILLLRESYVSHLLLNKDGKSFFLISAINATMSVISFIVSYHLSNSLILAVASVAAARVLSYSIFERKIVAPYLENVEWRPAFKLWAKPTWTLAHKAWPLGAAALLGALFTTIPRIAVDHYEGAAALGVFTALTSLLFFFNLLVNSFVQSALPAMASSYSEDRKLFLSKINAALIKIIVVGAFSVFLVFGAGDYVLWGVFGEEYKGYKVELMWVTVSGSFLAMFSIGNLMLSSQQSFFIQLPIYIIVSAVISIGAFVGGALYGMSGVLIGQSVGYMAGFLICYMCFKRRQCEG